MIKKPIDPMQPKQGPGSWVVIMLGLLMVTPLSFAAPNRPGPRPIQPPVFNYNILPDLYEALKSASNGDLYGASYKIKSVVRSARFESTPEQPTLVKMLRQSMRAINNGWQLGPKEKKTVVVDNLSVAIGIMIRDKNKPGITKSELQTALRHLRLGRLVGNAGFTGKMATQLAKGKFFLSKHKYAPAIKKALQLLKQAKHSLNVYAVDQVAINKAKQFTTKAIQTVRNSYIFVHGVPAGPGGRPGGPGGGGGFFKVD